MRLIDGDALLDEVMERHCKECDKRKGIKNGKYRIIYEIGDAPCRACDVDDVKDELEDAPTIEPQRKKGHWILVKGSNGKDYHKCSKCLHTQEITGVKNYCAVCGAEMGEQDETD